MASASNIIGISGAPCTGKTTLARSLVAAFTEKETSCELLAEPARQLVAHGVKIDRQMGESDYDAFLSAYLARESRARSTLAIADRTLIDHYSYLAANPAVAEAVRTRHAQAVLSNAQHYRLILYLPIELPMRDDGFREVSLDYQRALDQAILAMLAKTQIPITTISGNLESRKRQAYQAIIKAVPELQEASTSLHAAS